MSTFFDVAPSRVIPVSANEKYNLTKLVDEFVRALPAEKKITVFRAVNDELQSKATGIHVKKSFLDLVSDVICTTIEKSGDVLIKTVETVGNILEPAGDWIMDRLPLFCGGRGGGCYITTATFHETGKQDDCYDLTMFRAFRDDYLLKTPQGAELIAQYYKTAPSIVNIINRESNHSNIYNEIDTKYLSPCLAFIESGDLDKCEAHYKEMVEKLKERYLLWA